MRLLSDRTVKFGLLLLAAASILVSFTALRVARLAKTENGKHKSSAPEAEVLWDTWGVPHIFAASDTAAFRALGWAEMEDHANLLLHLYATSRGRAAEYFGARYLAGDLAVRTIGIDRLARTDYAKQAPWFSKNLDAFAQGVNEWAKQNASRLLPAARLVLPVSGTDEIAQGLWVGFYGFQSRQGGCGAVVPKGFAGSNGWAIGPSHSASGKAMLLANPHLAWSGPSTWEEAQVTAPGYSAYGGALVGFPVLAIAFNHYLGWTHTTNMGHPCYLYQLTPQAGGYLYDGHVLPFQTFTETLKIRQPDGQLEIHPVTLRRSVQGPVVQENGKLLAIRVAGLQEGFIGKAFEQWWKMGRARNLAQFEQAIRMLQISTQNIIYADRDGHVMLFYSTPVPQLPQGDWQYWLRPVPGNISSTLWTRILPFSDLPLVLDPSSGWVENSNSAPWYSTEPLLHPSKYPPYLSAPFNDPSGQANLREERGIQMLTSSPKISYAQLIEDKYSTRSLLADRILPPLLAATAARGDAKAKEAARILRAWDRCFDADSRGAVLFGAWYLEMVKHGSFWAVPFDPHRLLETPSGLKNPEAAVRALDVAAAEVQLRYRALDVPWGSVFRLARGRIDLPANGGPGDELGIFRVITYSQQSNGRFVSTGGDSFIAAVEFSNPLRARVLVTYGNSSDPRSPHYGDQLQLAAKKQLRDAWLTQDEIDSHLASCTWFEASGAVRTLCPDACRAAIQRKEL